MIPVLHRDLSTNALRELVTPHDVTTMQFTDEQRANLAARFRAVPTLRQRRLDAWHVERGGRVDDDFAWSPTTARRVLGNTALRRLTQQHVANVTAGVADAVDEQLDRAARGHARPGTLAAWLSNLDYPIQGIVMAEAVRWATQSLELFSLLDQPWRVAAVDAYYDVAGARTSLRGRRDVLIEANEQRVVVRVRSGLPGATAGAGLRADLTVDALAHPQGRAAARYVGLWPDAGVALAVDGTLETVRAGARDLVRAALANHKRQLKAAA